MTKISRAFFENLTINEMWNYIDYLQSENERWYNRCNDMYDQFRRQEAELQKARDLRIYKLTAGDAKKKETEVYFRTNNGMKW